MKTEEQVKQAKLNLELHLLAQTKFGNDAAVREVNCIIGAIAWVLDLPKGEHFEKFIMDAATTALAQNANNRNS